MYQSKKAFTLVELIVVIVILAILATIAFLSFSSQSGSARDSVRLSDATNIRKWLELRQAIGWSIPLPANPKTYTWWATATGVSWVMITEWTVNNSILSTLSAGIKDPSWSEYRYSTISQWWQPLYYQLALELENPTSLRENVVNPFIAMSEIIASADDTTSKIVQLKWNYMFDPSLPSLFILSGSTSSASWWIYNPDVCFALDWSATNTFSSKDNCVAKKDMNLKDYDNSLVWYWDMETLTADWKLKDISGNGNDGVFSGGMTYGNALTWWVVGKGLGFLTGTTNHIELINNTLTPSWAFTVSFFYKIQSKSNLSQIIIDNWNISTWSWFYFLRYYYTPSQNRDVMTFWMRRVPMSDNYYNEVLLDSSYGWNIPDAVQLNVFYHITLTFIPWESSKMCINWKCYLDNPPLPFQNIPKDYVFWKQNVWLWRDMRWYSQLDWTIDDIKLYNRALSDQEIIQQAKSAWF
ncbi:MAG: hypothetical protein ACD_3C00161G0003 [uncultured bacterium (gcode 4)]|uniref:Prepilin-type N-terminal cleavage/methylation domain-containing protein n=1 Tax=uncultured bacterium (gcode 4) TaxID=1234023 RepID=K2F9F6_9BACT|nr:MAG: hypothetical protein ACD_3C00161G0003 [uncultured bacterium (gcode 4)]